MRAGVVGRRRCRCAYWKIHTDPLYLIEFWKLGLGWIDVHAAFRFCPWCGLRLPSPRRRGR